MARAERYADPAYRAALKQARANPAYTDMARDCLQDYLTWISQEFRPRADWAHPNMASLVLAQGRAYTPAARPRGLRKMTNKLCYRNALWTAMDNPNLTYVEGYAMAFQGIPMEHAWCVTADGLVVDPTWYDPDLGAYFGVAIPLEIAGGLVARQGRYGILVNDWKHDYRILRSGRIELPTREEASCA